MMSVPVISLKRICKSVKTNFLRISSSGSGTVFLDMFDNFLQKELQLFKQLEKRGTGFAFRCLKYGKVSFRRLKYGNNSDVDLDLGSWITKKITANFFFHFALVPSVRILLI